MVNLLFCRWSLQKYLMLAGRRIPGWFKIVWDFQNVENGLRRTRFYFHLFATNPLWHIVKMPLVSQLSIQQKGAALGSDSFRCSFSRSLGSFCRSSFFCYRSFFRSLHGSAVCALNIYSFKQIVQPSICLRCLFAPPPKKKHLFFFKLNGLEKILNPNTRPKSMRQASGTMYWTDV